MGPCLDTGNPDVEKTSLPPEDGHPGLDFTSPRHIRLFDRPKDISGSDSGFTAPSDVGY